MATSTTGPALGGDIAAYRGDTFERWIRIRRNGIEEALNSSTFTMQIRNGASLVKELKSNDGISVVGIPGGVLYLVISAAVMATLTPGAYSYDMQQETPDGKSRTRFRGTFTISDDVTKPTA